MVFSSLQFIYLFLPLSIIFYYIIDRRYKNYVLLVISLLFYAWGEPKFVLVLILMCFFNWSIAYGMYLLPKLKKLLCVLAISADFGMLFIFKYMNFVTLNISKIFTIRVTSIALPIGISFFTFQMLSYIIDVYRKPNEYICKNPTELMLYISFFPQLIAGPIVRYNSIIAQIKCRQESLTLMFDGVCRFIVGLSKKVIIANSMAIIADKAFSVDDLRLSMGFAWLGAVAYTLQIYYDFSGYSDMAIGLGKMFGFVFDENFNYPYAAKSVTDFWRRWHISLSAWFRDYVYIPLGGDGRDKRNKTFYSIRNLFIVWVFTGFWHGAQWTFLLWGIGYFVLLIVEKSWIIPETKSRLFRCAYRILTLLFIIVLWVVFRADSIGQLKYYLKAMFFGGVGTSIIDSNFIFYSCNYAIVFILAILGALPFIKNVKNKLKDNVLFTICYSFLLFALFVVDISYLVMGYHNPFIYFNF